MMRDKYLVLATYLGAGAAGVGAPGSFLRGFVVTNAVVYLSLCGLDAWRESRRRRTDRVIPPEVLEQLRDVWQSLDFKAPPTLGTQPMYVQLHTGDPGEYGMDNVACKGRREMLNLVPMAVGGTFELANRDQLAWRDVPATETYVRFTTWDSPAGGSLLYEGLVEGEESESVTGVETHAGSDFIIPPGRMEVFLIHPERKRNEGEGK